MLEAIPDRLGTTLFDLVVVLVSVVVVYAAVIAATRMVGLRSFSKMSAFDFAMTVAVGSVIASVGTGNVALLDGLMTVGLLFAAQFGVAWSRQHTSVAGIVDNRPLLLMHRGTILHAHLRRARITQGDLMAKLRAVNVLDPGDVLAVVLETTGDVSVLMGDHVDAALLDGVIGAERIAG